MSNTRDFSGLKDAEGWSTVRHHKETPKTMSSFARKPYPAQPPRFSREQYAAEERMRKEEAVKRAEQERRAQSELNEVNFPSMGSAFAEAAAPKASAWSKSGKELAEAWKTADEENRLRALAEEMARKEEEERERREAERYLRVPRYRMSARPDEDTYYEDEEEPPANGGAGYRPPPQDEGWERVEKKTRVQRERRMSEEDDAPASSVWEDEVQNDTFDSHARPGRRDGDSIW